MKHLAANLRRRSLESTLEENGIADKLYKFLNPVGIHDPVEVHPLAGLRAAGLTPREPEEEFYVGRLNCAKGARLRY